MNNGNKSQICLILKIGITERVDSQKVFININCQNVDIAILFNAQR